MIVPPLTLYIEDRDVETREGPAFESLGYRLTRPADDIAMRGLNAYWGGVHAVAWQGGRWVGAADPRRDGTGRAP